MTSLNKTMLLVSVFSLAFSSLPALSDPIEEQPAIEQIQSSLTKLICCFTRYAAQSPITFLLPPSVAFSVSSMILNRYARTHVYYEHIRLTATFAGLSPLFFRDYCGA